MNLLLSILFVLTVALASNDGYWFPYINLLGFVTMGLFVWLIAKEEK